LVAGQRFDDFYVTHFPVLTVQLTAYIGDLNEAQDVVQEAFCRAWTRWERLEAYDEPVTWVRRQRIDVVEGPSPDRVALDRALATLPPNQRKAVVLHHVAGLSVPEIAAELAVAEGTVKSWLHRGRTALNAALSTHREADR